MLFTLGEFDLCRRLFPWVAEATNPRMMTNAPCSDTSLLKPQPCAAGPCGAAIYWSGFGQWGFWGWFLFCIVLFWFVFSLFGLFSIFPPRGFLRQERTEPGPLLFVIPWQTSQSRAKLQIITSGSSAALAAALPAEPGNDHCRQ